MVNSIDMLKEFKNLYLPSPKEPIIVEAPTFHYLMLDGSGDPNTSSVYQETVTALYNLAYTLKFAFKKAGEPDVKVMPLEGLWWVEGEQHDQADFLKLNKDSWFWTMMIAQPSLVTADWVEVARKQALAKEDPTSRVDRIRFQAYNEGTAVQLMHIGPYSAEAPNIARMHAFAIALGYRLTGKHHEIYHSDPRRTAPEKMRTVLRQPIQK